MTERRDFEDGAFYWVRQGDEWTVARRWRGEWLQVADDFTRADQDIDEIGPCLGKGPPGEAACALVTALEHRFDAAGRLGHEWGMAFVKAGHDLPPPLPDLRARLEAPMASVPFALAAIIHGSGLDEGAAATLRADADRLFGAPVSCREALVIMRGMLENAISMAIKTPRAPTPGSESNNSDLEGIFEY